MEFLAVLIVWGIPIIFGVIAMKMAEARNRSKVTGFFAGFFFTVLALLYYSAAGSYGGQPEEQPKPKKRKASK